MWPYRFLTGHVGAPIPAMPFSPSKPFGYSSFPREQSAVPRRWAETLFPNLVFFAEHDVVSSPLSRLPPLADTDMDRAATLLRWNSLLLFCRMWRSL